MSFQSSNARVLAPQPCGPAQECETFQLGSTCVPWNVGVALGLAREAVGTDFALCARGEVLS